MFLKIIFVFLKILEINIEFHRIRRNQKYLRQNRLSLKVDFQNRLCLKIDFENRFMNIIDFLSLVEKSIDLEHWFQVSKIWVFGPEEYRKKIYLIFFLNFLETFLVPSLNLKDILEKNRFFREFVQQPIF
jgi:hypothetical protein